MMKPWISALTALGFLLTQPACTPSAEKPSEKAKAPAAEIQKKAEVWTCPMHPQVRKSEPGRCPICGMDLVKVEESEHDHATESGAAPAPTALPEGHARFELALPRSQMIGVKTGKVIRRPLFKEIRAPGRVAFDPELYTAQSEFQEAIRQLERVRNSPLADARHSAERMVESSKIRLKILGLSDAQISRLAQGKQPSDSQLLLPKSGEEGWIYAEIYEMDLASVTPGLEAEITAASLHGARIKGKVVSVDRILNTTTRTTRVRIEIPSAKAALRPETYVDATILAPLGKQIAVPLDAIFDTGREAWVFVAEPEGKFSPRSVRIKFHAGDWVAIGEGLKEGETIVTSANFLIDSESRLRGAALGE